MKRASVSLDQGISYYRAPSPPSSEDDGLRLKGVASAPDWLGEMSHLVDLQRICDPMARSDYSDYHDSSSDGEGDGGIVFVAGPKRRRSNCGGSVQGKKSFICATHSTSRQFSTKPAPDFPHLHFFSVSFSGRVHIAAVVTSKMSTSSTRRRRSS